MAANPEALSRSGRGDLAGARTLGPGLDLERHSLTTDKAIELEGSLNAASMEEVVLAVGRSDEAEASVANDLLDDSRGHARPLSSLSEPAGRRTVRESGSTTRSIVT